VTVYKNKLSRKIFYFGINKSEMENYALNPPNDTVSGVK
jgi:hypothetical protein